MSDAKSSSESKGRRPRRSRRESKAESKDEGAGSFKDDDGEAPDVGTSVRSQRRSSGWGNEAPTPNVNLDEDKKGQKSRNTSSRGSRRRQSTEQDSSSKKNRHFDDDDETTEIMEIPDLEEEEEEEDMTVKIASAPRNVGRQVQSLRELNLNIQKGLPAPQKDGLDLSLLTSMLCPQMAVQEKDEVWDFDTLLQEVAQSMQQEQDEMDGPIGNQEIAAP